MVHSSAATANGDAVTEAGEARDGRQLFRISIDRLPSTAPRILNDA